MEGRGPRLAPPLLSKINSKTGKVVKREFGMWVIYLFRILAKLKWVRGTVLDIFALTLERRLEQEDLACYRMDLAEICNGLSPENYDAAVEVAKIPEKLRGYGHIKARNRKTLLCRRSQLLDEFRGNIQFVEINEKKAA